tara:strand:+ start:26 stop:352 length:327 start_codon:yes stop_codon:yes gene_type:complete
MAEDFAPGSFDLNYDPVDKTAQRLHFTTDNKMILETVTDITELAEENAAIRADVSKTGRVGDMVRVARLPMSVYIELSQRGVTQDKKAMKSWLASDEGLPYRTHWMTS